MSILKGILHHWNKTSSSYDTIHPETESAQITDWDAGIGATLAKTTLGSLITTLSSDSFAAKVVKMVLDATGVKYSMGTNGYFCFGSLFGGLIIQWGVMSEETSTSFNVNLNVTMNVICAIPYDISSNPSSICYLCWMNEKTTTMTLAFCASTVPYGLGWIAIGK
ncbi:hypothetical protein ACT01_11290 [Megasphaera hexanoica]|uniref:gp53-like domain-containing protein n=1 Tax=Megasphaera hexanoica TaxID=1675036 RepID=UPI000DEAB659|nr:hypothetical protein [Megasphaera hexanoica]AXB82770.1 hypothetical protein ACT01_11290 [Megasphaera hexanoica]